MLRLAAGRGGARLEIQAREIRGGGDVHGAARAHGVPRNAARDGGEPVFARHHRDGVQGLQPLHPNARVGASNPKLSARNPKP